MTKAKTTAAEAETPPVDTTTQREDTLQADSGDTPPPTTEEQEAARAEAEAMLAAQAEADAAAAAAAAEAEAERLAQEATGADAQPTTDPDGNPPSEETPEPAPGPNLRVLNHLTKQVEMLNHFGLRQQLVDEMRDLYGATIVEADGEGVTIEIEGVSIDPADCMESALTNWAAAARRTILEATA